MFLQNKNLRNIYSVSYFQMEQVRRIELPSQPWQGYILTIEPHLHALIYYQIKNNISRKKCNFYLYMIQC